MEVGSKKESKTGFEIFSPKLRELIRERGFTSPTPPQSQAFSQILEGHHTLIIAPPGSGKTESAFLPVLELMMRSRANGISALYITPLRALNRDLLSRLEWWCSKLGFRIDIRHGDTPPHTRRSQAISPPDLLITTPETLQLILISPRLMQGMKSLRFLILDELHELLGTKRGSQLSIGLERLALRIGEFQRIALCAPIWNPEIAAKFIFGDRPHRILDFRGEKSLELKVIYPKSSDDAIQRELGISQDQAARLELIRDLARKYAPSLVFANTRETAELLGAYLRKLGMRVEVHHSSLSSQLRSLAEQRFKSGQLDVLIATSSMELGIDIGDVKLVIQYGSPKQPSRLLQRVSRAGHRLDLVSKGVIIPLNLDEIPECWAICHLASRGQLEPIQIQPGLDVIANQLIGLALEYRGISIRDAFKIISRAYPFRDVDLDKLESILEILSSLKLIKIKQGILIPARECWRYISQRISMIPQEAEYRARSVSGEFLGNLDSGFVAQLNPGDSFLLKGEPWRVIQIDHASKTVDLEPFAGNPDPAFWSGEQLLVPAQVAELVGKIRSKLGSSGGSMEIFQELSKDFGADWNGFQSYLRLIEAQSRYGIPDGSKLVIEIGSGNTVIHTCLGDRMNLGLGLLISTLIWARTGFQVEFKRDAYRIILGRALSRDQILDCVNLDPQMIEPLLVKSLRNSRILNWKLEQVAARFGFKLDSPRALEPLKDTIVFQEAVREIFSSEMDLDGLKHLISKIRSGELKLEFLRGLSPLGNLGLSQIMQSGYLDLIRSRMLSQRIVLICISCREWHQEFSVGALDPNPRCPKCNSLALAGVKPWEAASMLRLLKLGSHSPQYRRSIQRLCRSADLIQSHGSRAALVLSSKGIGPNTAAKLLRISQESELIQALIQAQRRYLITRKFWN